MYTMSVHHDDDDDDDDDVHKVMNQIPRNFNDLNSDGETYVAPTLS
jgi:hypothetical protein